MAVPATNKPPTPPNLLDAWMQLYQSRHQPPLSPVIDSAELKVSRGDAAASWSLLARFAMDKKGADCDDQAYEDRHVHQVYQQIAPHFSSTRYKPWPIVEKFLQDQPDGAIGLDVGCGNGKYLAVNPRIFIVGSDRSQALVEIAKKHEPHSVIVADTLNLPHPSHMFDFIISIAVLHHLASPSRRVRAIEELLQLLRDPPSSIPEDTNNIAKGLIYVWALEQKTSRRGWDAGGDQDVMVPWVMKEKSQGGQAEESKTFNRFYHLYRSGELESDITKANGRVITSGYEKDNWWAIVTKISS